MGNPGLLAELFATKSEVAGWFRSQEAQRERLWSNGPKRNGRRENRPSLGSEYGTLAKESFGSA